MQLKFAILWLTFFQLSLAQHTITGTLYASDVKGFVVIGCLVDMATQDCDYEKTNWQRSMPMVLTHSIMLNQDTIWLSFGETPMAMGN